MRVSNIVKSHVDKHHKTRIHIFSIIIIVFIVIIIKLMVDERSVLCYYVSADEGKVVCNGTVYGSLDSAPSDHLSPTGGLFWTYLGVYIALVMFAGLMSGLTMGLLSLDIVSLEVLKRSGKPREKKFAERILKLVRQHHLLLVTLLLANAAAVESMPIFLDKITNEIIAILISVTAVLVFGEIIPQAVCTRFGLAVGYYCAPLVYLLLATFFIVAFPISKLLDCILGEEHGTFFRRVELKELVNIHGNRDNRDNEEPLSEDEVLIVKSALEMRDKTVSDAMTPLESVFMLNARDRLGAATMNEIISRGFSRIPVYENDRTNITGILLVKKLIRISPQQNKTIGDIRGAIIKPPSCSANTPLFDILNMFQTGKSHLYTVYSTSDDLDLIGIITLEDVIEELIGEEIIDETDRDVQRRVSVARAKVQLYRRQSCNVIEPQIPHSLKVCGSLQSCLPSVASVPASLNENTPLLINAEIEPS